MARYRGPRLRVMRALGVQLPGLSEKVYDERRPYPPGMHQGSARRKVSVYGHQLKEKQKLRFNYGLMEKQFRRYVEMSFRQKGDPGENIMVLLERRLDNAVFRAGYGRSIPFSRQLVTHGHIYVDGVRVKSPSFLVKEGQLITLSKKAQDMEQLTKNLENPALYPPEWIEVDAASKVSKIIRLPDTESLPLRVDIKAVVEFYSR